MTGIGGQTSGFWPNRGRVNLSTGNRHPDGRHPVIWSNEKMIARDIYIRMGHHPSLLKNENYTTLLKNSILWAAGHAGQTGADIPEKRE